jgi:hypothetical protein
MLLKPHFTDLIGLPCESQSQISVILTEALSLEMRRKFVFRHRPLLAIVFTIISVLFCLFATGKLGKLSVYTRGVYL